MNVTTTFEPAADGWFHVAPHGTFPHPNGAQQVIDAEACETMAQTFAEEARQANFPGLLVDFDHFSHDPGRASAAAGWVTGLQPRADGLYAQVRWSDLGEQALKGGRYRLVSPVWNRDECDSWTAPAGPAGQEALHVRPRRLARLALTNDPNLPGLAPLTNRNDAPKGVGAEAKAGRSAGKAANPAAKGSHPAKPVEAPPRALPPRLRAALLELLNLAAGASDAEIAEAVRAQRGELESLRNRCARLQEAEAEAELDSFADVITNRAAIRAQLLANREGTLAVLQALRRPEPCKPLHDPQARRPHLHLLAPYAGPEAEAGGARRIANRARQLQAQLKIGHHAAFRLAEGEETAA